jgi:hypothetical protein
MGGPPIYESSVRKVGHCQSKDRNNQSNVKVGTIILSCDWLISLGSEERVQQ